MPHFFRLHSCAIGLALCIGGSAFAQDQTKPVKVTVGTEPPTYVGREIGGPDVNLDTKSGTAYVVTFWASWCGPCLQELPMLTNIQKIAGSRMQVIAVNIEDRDTYRRLQRIIKDVGLTSTFDPDKRAQKAFGVKGIPHMVIVGRDGLVTAVRVGYSEAKHDQLAAELNRALEVQPRAAEDSPPPAKP